MGGLSNKVTELSSLNIRLKKALEKNVVSVHHNTAVSRKAKLKLKKVSALTDTFLF